MSGKKTVLITGCSAAGIGWHLAKEFHSRGYRVFATSRRLETMDQLSAIGIETFVLDVTDGEAIRSMKDEISARTGGSLDILVNNAGRAPPAAVSDLDMSDVRALFETNLFGPMGMVQQFLPLLIASGKACVVNTGSLAAIVPSPFLASYNASKAALHSFSNTLRIELAPFNVRVVDLMTGPVQTTVMPPYSIPDGSLYKSLDPQYQEYRAQNIANSMPVDEYARYVVAQVDKTNPRRIIWAGNSTTMAWFLVNFMPSFVMDSVLGNMFGLPKLVAQVQNADKHL